MDILFGGEQDRDEEEENELPVGDPVVIAIEELEKQCEYESDGNYNPITTSEESDCGHALRRRSRRCYYDPNTLKPYFEVRMIFRNKKEFDDALTKHALTEKWKIKVFYYGSYCCHLFYYAFVNFMFL